MCFCVVLSLTQWNIISIAFDLLCFIVLLTIPIAVELSVWMVVGSFWGCPISSNLSLKSTFSLPFRNNHPSSASDADAITFFNIAAITKMAPLWLVCCPYSIFLLRKKCPPNLLLALNSDKYEASLCTCNTISLANYLIFASSCVAQ